MTEPERIRRFEAAYNRVDKALEDIAAGKGNHRRRTYASKVRIAANQVRRLAKHVDFLLEVGELRNAIVHNRLGDGTYIAVPLEETVLSLESIEETLFRPEAVIPRFQRKVRSLDAHDPIASVLELMRDTGFSKFPIYDRGAFIGLLTSDGFARWCARQATNGDLHIKTDEVTVREVVAIDHRRQRIAFVARHEPIDDIEAMFRDSPQLEVVIVTEHGRVTEKPIGLITAGDLINSEK